MVSDIDQMVQEVERYKSEDEANRDDCEAAKTKVESLPTNNIKQIMEEEKRRGKISEQDKNKILDKGQAVINWLDRNQMTERDEYAHKQRELERMQPHHRQALPRRSRQRRSSGGPAIEEVD